MGKGEGKLPRASMKGGRSSAFELELEFPEEGEIDLMPTIMMGTIRLSPFSPLSSLLFASVPALVCRCPCEAAVLPFEAVGLDAADAPNRNILKKLRGG